LGIVALRHSWREIFLWKTEDKAERKKKGAKKKEKEALWKLTPLMEIRPERGFPERLGKHKTLSTVPTRPDGGSITGIHFSLGRRMGSASNIKRQVCQFQTVSTEGFTPVPCAKSVPESDLFMPLGLALSEKQIPQIAENTEKSK